MKSVFGPAAAAVLLALAGGIFWIAGQTSRHLAAVHKQLATLHYAAADSEGDEVEQALGVERRVPVLGGAAATDVRDVRAAARYWRSDYTAIVPQDGKNAVATATDPAILFLSANAAFRLSQTTPDAADVVRRLDTVIKSYTEVLKSSPGQMDAAYNYEYAIRARKALTSPRPASTAKNAPRPLPKASDEPVTDLPGGPTTLHGRRGGPPPATDMNQFKIAIPKRSDERKDAPEPGKGGQPTRKG